MRLVLFIQLKVVETYYEYYKDSRDKFVEFNGYCAIFKQHVFFAYKKCEFYELIPFKEIVRTVKMNHLNELNQLNESEQHDQPEQSDILDLDSDLTHLGNDALFFK
jgi:hypothetical protein